jgi:hypothetical protein
MQTQPKQRAYVVLQRSDFADPAVWSHMLDSFDIPHGEEAGFTEPPDTIELWTAKVEVTED